VLVVDTLTSSGRSRRRDRALLKHPATPVAAVISPTPIRPLGGGALACSMTRPWSAAKSQSSRPSLHQSTRFGKTSSSWPAMLRRAQYQFVPLLARSARARFDCGLGSRWRQVGLAVAARRSHMETGDKRTNRVRIRIPMAPNREAPAESFFHPALQALNLAENCTHNFPQSAARSAAPSPRCAVPGRNIWAKPCICEGGKAEAMWRPHHWPVWGQRAYRQ